MSSSVGFVSKEALRSLAVILLPLALGSVVRRFNEHYFST